MRRPSTGASMLDPHPPIAVGQSAGGENSPSIPPPRKGGERLATRLERGTASPIEGLSGALSLVRALQSAAGAGTPVGWWDAADVISLDDGPAWGFATSGGRTLPLAGELPDLRTAAEAATCAPEVATGAVQLDRATEAERVAAESYALGATLFLALTGSWPLAADDAPSYLRRQLVFHPRPPTDLAPYLERYKLLSELCRDCLQRAPSERPGTYAELLRRIEDAKREAERLDSDVAFLPARVSDTMEIRRSRLRDTTTEHRRRSPSRWAQLGALALLVAILLFLLLRQTAGRSSSPVLGGRGPDPGSDPLDEGRDPLPHPDAEGREAAALAVAGERVDEGHQDPRA